MMKALLLKEFYVASKTCRSILLVIVAFFALSFSVMTASSLSSTR